MAPAPLPSVGLGFKAQHFAAAMAVSAEGTWFEVHAENYMVSGGPRRAMLETLRERYPLSLHGVGLSLVGPDLPDEAHLRALRQLVDRFEPMLVSEHLAWSRLGGEYHPNLLPFPRTTEALELVCRNVAITQDMLGRQVLVENPSHYLALPGHAWSESDFLAEIARRTGCGLLLDLNNVHVSAANLGFSACDYIADFPSALVGEIHLAGCAQDPALDLLIDDHGSPVTPPVLALLAGFLDRHGQRPVLIEWDRNVPDFAVLARQQQEVAHLIATHTRGKADA